MTLNCIEEATTLEKKLEYSLDIDIEDIRVCHRKLVDSNYTGLGDFLGKLLIFYFNLSIKSALKRPIRAILKDASIPTSLLAQHMSELVITRVSSLSGDMFVCVEECIEQLPGGQACVEGLLYFILTGMNLFILSNIVSIQKPVLLSVIKSYHKIIVKCNSSLLACQSISHISEYIYIKEQLHNLVRNSDREVKSPPESTLFEGVAQCMCVDNVDISHTSIILCIQVMCSLHREAAMLDLYTIHETNMSNPTPSVRVLFALISSSIELLFYQTNPKSKLVFVSIVFAIEKLLNINQSIPRLLLCRCLHSCIVSLRKCVTKSIHKQTIGLSLVETDRNIKQVIVAIVMGNWNSHIETIRHIAKDIFMELLSLLKEVLLGDEAQTVFEQFAESFLLLEAKSTTKYKYLCLLSSYIPLSRWLVLDPLLPSKLPTLMDESALATHVGEFWCRLVCQSSVLFYEIRPWIDAIISVVSEVSAKHSQNIYDFCKKGIVSCRSDILQYIANQVPDTDQGNIFLIQCLKQAQRQHPSTNVTRILSKDKLMVCLVSCSSELSISVLDLICRNPKSTSIISEQDLALVLKGFTLLVDTPSVSNRKNLISTLTALLRHIEQSAHKHTQHNKQDTGISHYSVFLSSFSSLLFSLLSPTSSHGCREIVLYILSVVIQLFQNKQALFPPNFEIQDSHLECLLASLKDTFELHCRMSFDILTLLRDRLRVWLSFMDNYLNFVNVMFSLMLSPVSVHSTSASFYVRLLFRMDPNKLYTFIQGKYTYLNEQLESPLPTEPIDIPHNQVHFSCLSSLLCLLSIQLEMSRDRWDPSKNCFYPIIRCIRGLLDECSIEEVSSYVTHFQKCLDSIIHLCSQVLAVTGHIVCNSSPEGYLPDSSEQIQQLGGRAVLLCSWHSLKEISLLFSEIIESFFPPLPSLFYPSILTAIYSFYLNYLMEARHRGAFELTYVGFVRLCQCLWLSPTDSVCDLPALWLEEVLSSLQNKESQKSQLKLLSCATRRSAGLPYLVLAILANEPKHLNNKYLSITMETLTRLADKAVDTPEDVIVKVHCLNILRALFKDNKLRDLMHQYVSKAFTLVIASVSSKYWPIRNASQLLFSGVMSRVFGVKRTQDEHSWLNKMTTRNFFTRYPSLWQVFKDNISIFVQTPHTLHPDNSVFLLLTVLSRLYISKLDTNSDHMAFLIPKLFTLCANPSWKLREMCANSISSLLSSQSFPQVFPYFQQQSHLYRDSSTYNATHGFLLTLREFVQFQISRLSADELATLFKFCINLIQVSTLCIVNQCTLFQLFSILIEQSQVIFFDLVSGELKELNSHLIVCSVQKQSLFEQSRLSSFLRLTIAVLSKPHISPDQSGLSSVVHRFLDTPDLRQCLIRSVLETELSPPLTILPFHKLFSIFLDSTQEERIELIRVTMRIIDNTAGIVHELSKHKSSDSHRALRIALNLIEECSVDNEYLPNIIKFSCCLLLSIEPEEQIIATDLSALIKALFVIATSPQISSQLVQAMESTLVALYKLILSLPLDNETNNKFWFLLLYVLHQCTDGTLASLLYSTLKDTSNPTVHIIQSLRVHPNIATQFLLENIRLFLEEETSIGVLLFLLQRVFILESVCESEEDKEKLFEETSVDYGNIPVIVLLYICSTLHNIVLHSQNTQFIIELIKQVYLVFREELESVSPQDKLAWNRKLYLNKLIYSLLHNVLQTSSIGHIQDIAILQSSDLFSSEALLEQTVYFDAIVALFDK